MRERARRNYRIGEHQTVRAHRIRVISMCLKHVIAGGRGEIRSQMTTRGKTDYSNRLRINMPFSGMLTNHLHRIGSFQKRNWKNGRFYRISQHKSIETGREELHRDRLRFAIGRHFVTAARNHENGRTYTIGNDFFTVVKAISDEFRCAAIDAKNFVFEIFHISIIGGTRRTLCRNYLVPLFFVPCDPWMQIVQSGECVLLEQPVENVAVLNALVVAETDGI